MIRNTHVLLGLLAATASLAAQSPGTPSSSTPSSEAPSSGTPSSGTRGDGDAARRPAWDQPRAVARVQQVLAIEQRGRPWDEIAWRTDPDLAVAEARRDDLPILVYFYLEKDVGPKHAPC